MQKILCLSTAEDFDDIAKTAYMIRETCGSNVNQAADEQTEAANFALISTARDFVENVEVLRLSSFGEKLPSHSKLYWNTNFLADLSRAMLLPSVRLIHIDTLFYPSLWLALAYRGNVNTGAQGRRTLPSPEVNISMSSITIPVHAT